MLTVGVVAPYVYSLSRGEENEYFNVGLKLVAGSLVAMNIRPILVTAAPLLKIIADAAVNESKTISADMRAQAVEGEIAR